MKDVLSLGKKVFLFFSLLFLSACVSTKFVPLPPKVVTGVYHPVKKGETLWRICKTYDVALQEVAEINNIKDASQIEVSDKIFIPGATKVLRINVVKKETPGYDKSIVKQTGKYDWPVKGKIVSHFGIKDGRKYDGIDILVPLGTPVKAADAGKVIFSNKLSGYGNLIIIQHGDKYTTIYAHNQANLVDEGKWIERGSIIAEAGNSHDRSASSTLHFQVRRNNKSRNPLFFLP